MSPTCTHSLGGRDARGRCILSRVGIYNNVFNMISAALNSLFDTHVSALAEARKRRREDLALRGALEVYTAPNDARTTQTRQEDEEPQYGLALPDDVYEGDAHLRTLNRLLAEIDKRGFERSSQQVEFHEV